MSGGSVIRWLRSLSLAFVLPALMLLASCSPDDKSVTAPTAPAAPTGVTVTPGDASNTITWTGSSNATSYNIYWKIGTGATTADNKLANVTSPFVHTPISNGTQYAYVVTAVGSGGESAASTEAHGTPQPGPPTIPLAPTNVQITAGDHSNVISWNLSAGATSYNLYWRVGAGATTSDTKIPNATTPY